MGASVRITTIDWPRVILEIRGRRRLQVKQIAAKVGMSATGLHNIASGATREPCYSVGLRLLELRGQI